jgi:hypothetical protein
MTPKVVIHAGRILYRLVLPLLLCIFLLIVSGNISRPLFLGSKLLDFIARLWLCLIFSMGYIIVSDLERYKSWFYGGKISNLTSANDPWAMLLNVIMGLMFGIFAALISWWAVRTFLPIFNGIALIVALVNGILFFIPVFSERNRFSL